VIAEAMACGVPCVATDVGDTATIMGPFGSVVPPGDPERLAAALQHVLERRTTAGGAACRERIATRFGVEQMVTRTMQLLGQCFDATR
jgi:glycosyltransferase involved in cell wall biosynthesis